MTRGLGKIPREELRNFVLITEYHYIDDQIREGTMASDHVTRTKRVISEIKREIEDNIKTDLEEIGLIVWT